MKPVTALSRPLLASIFIMGGFEAVKEPEPRAKLAGPVLDRVTEAVPSLPLERVQMVQANGAVQMAAGSLLAIGKLPRLSALALAGSIVPTTIGGHRFWEEDEPQKARQQRTHFLKNAAILGGLLVMATQPRGKRKPSRRKARRAKAKAGAAS